MMQGITFEVHISEEDLIEFFKQYKQPDRENVDYTVFQPVQVGYTVHYAVALEYGTGPLREYQPTVHHGDYTYESIWEEIDEWARKKLKMQYAPHRENFVTGVVNRMWEKGLYPHRFWRPAQDWMFENIPIYLANGLSMYDCARDALRMSDRIIIETKLPYQGRLQQSAICEKMDFDEVGSVGPDARSFDDWWEKA